MAPDAVPPESRNRLSRLVLARFVSLTATLGVCYTFTMTTPHTIPEFRRWLRAEINTIGQWLDAPEVQENSSRMR